MPSTQVSPVKILLDLGIDLSTLSSEEDYLSALKEGAAMLQVGGGNTDGRFKILTDEVRKVRKSRKEDAPSAGMKVTKRRISPQKLLNPSQLKGSQEGGGDLLVIKEKVVSIEALLGEQYNFQVDQAKEAAKEKEDKRRKLKEKLLEGSKNIWGGIKKVAGAVISPFKSIWGKILGFIQTIILGRVLFKILEWGANKENQEKIKNIFKFLKNWWPTLLTAYILFGTTFGRMVTKLVAIVLSSMVKLAALIPKLLAKIAALRSGKILKGLGGLLGGGKLKGLTGMFQMGAGAFEGGGYVDKVQYYNEGGPVQAINSTITHYNKGGAVNSTITHYNKGGFVSPAKALGSSFSSPKKIEKMNKGGKVPGSGNTDTVPAMLTPGEFVMSKGAVQMYGVNTMKSMNAAGGGTNIPSFSYNQGGSVINNSLPDTSVNYHFNSGGLVNPSASSNITRIEKELRITPSLRKKAQVIVVGDSNEEKNTRDANLPPAGSREIPSFDATAIRSSRKMEVLGVNP